MDTTETAVTTVIDQDMSSGVLNLPSLARAVWKVPFLYIQVITEYIGNWSAGRHYENVGKLEDTCIWAEKPVTQKLQVLPSTVEKTFDTQPTPTKPDPPILPTSIVVKVGVLIVVMLLSCVCALMILKRHCCRKDEHHHAAIGHQNSRTNRHEYFPGNIGSRCDVGGHPSELSEGNGINGKSLQFDFCSRLAFAFATRGIVSKRKKCNARVLDWASSKSLSSMLTESSSRSRLDDSVGYALLPADWSLACSSAPAIVPLVSDHTSSFDSGIDRRSVTPPASTSSNTYAPPPAAPPKNNK